MTVPLVPAALGGRVMRRVREGFLSLGWTQEASAARLGIRNLATLGQAPALGDGAVDPLGLLCRVFLLDEGVPCDALAAALGSRTLDALERMHLLQIGDGRAACPLNLFPCEGLYVATDKRGLHPGFNQVMWLYPECWQLARLAMRCRTKRALDLCTGCGIHALLAGRFADDVIAVDTNPRAIAFAELNRALNGIARVTFLEGNLYQPLEELAPSRRRFGTITANPPYHPVLSSKAGDNAYSGGESGEEILEAIVRGLREHLGHRGTCRLMTLFLHREGVLWNEKLRDWTGTGFEIATRSTRVAYPSSLRAELVRLGLEDAGALRRSLQAQRVTGFSFGLLTIRRNVMLR